MRLMETAVAFGNGAGGGTVVFSMAGLSWAGAFGEVGDGAGPDDTPIPVAGTLGVVEAAWVVPEAASKSTTIRRKRVYRSMGSFLSYEVKMNFSMVLYFRAFGQSAA
jgi:hypothetical protein